MSLVSTDAQATFIVQTDSEALQLGFEGFNSNLGTLNSVTLKVDVLEKYRDWVISVPSDSSTTREVSWSIDGQYLLMGYSFPDGLSFPATYFPITGSGTTTVTLDPAANGMAYGYFTTMASGSASYSLDPADFVFNILEGEPRFIFTGDDTGLYDAGGDTQFTVAGQSNLVQVSGFCNGSQGDDSCGWVNYTLTYDYTPSEDTAAVPEPSTWTMMLVGFGAIGWSMRGRRRRVLVAAQR
jgi:hypothetical protein